MPLFEFHCRDCDADFEELVSSASPEALSKVTCPECGGRDVTKKLSVFASRVSGSGSASRAGAVSCVPSGGG